MTEKKPAAAKPVCPSCGKKNVRKMKEEEFEQVQETAIEHYVLLRINDFDSLDPVLCSSCYWLDFRGNLGINYPNGLYRNAAQILGK